MRILVVEHERNADAALVGEHLARARAQVEVVGPEIGVPIPRNVEGYDGVIVLGGTPGPDDDDLAPWLPGVRTLIRQCLDQEVPYLGICLGGQLLAHVAGGRVGDVRNGPEIGVYEMSPTPHAAGDPILGGLTATVRAVQWHWLEVHDLPPGSVSLCSSEQCPNQAFRVGPVAWGTQFHLEALARTLIGWARDDREDLSGLGLRPADLAAEVSQAEDELRRTWGAVVDRWIDVTATRRRRSPSVHPPDIGESRLGGVDRPGDDVDEDSC